MEDRKILNDNELEKTTGGLYISHNIYGMQNGVTVRCFECDSVFTFDESDASDDKYFCPVCQKWVSIETA